MTQSKSSVLNNETFTFQEIPAAVLKEAAALMEEFMNKLSPYLNMSPNGTQMRGMQHMGESSTYFVRTAIERAQEHPEFLMGNQDLQLAQLTLAMYESLGPILAAEDQSKRIIEYNRERAGAICLAFSNSFYHNVKRQAMKKEPIAESIYTELKGRYEREGRKPKKPSA